MWNQQNYGSQMWNQTSYGKNIWNQQGNEVQMVIKPEPGAQHSHHQEETISQIASQLEPEPEATPPAQAEYDYFMRQFAMRKEAMKTNFSQMVDDLFDKFESQFFPPQAFTEDLSVQESILNPGGTESLIGNYIQKIEKDVHFLLVSGCEQIFSDYEQSIDVGQDILEANNFPEEMPMEIFLFETTEVKRRSRKTKVKMSDQALICMDKTPGALEKPHYCKWPGCDHTSRNYYNVAKHVRYAHFNLPITRTEQFELNIEDSRDQFKFVGTLSEAHPEKEILVPTEEEQIRANYDRQDNFKCKLKECGRTFKFKATLIAHERIHLGVKPFSCKFPGCDFRSLKRNVCRRHIRQKHFHLPKTYKKQVALQIIDERDPDVYIEESAELLSLL